MPVFTHDRIDVSQAVGVKGALNKPGVLWGGHALQSIAIARHTPREPQQAIGSLGVVDYTSGQITSDLTLDAVITEGGTKADRIIGTPPNATGGTNSINAYARQAITVGVESYVLTSAGVNFPAGAPAQLSVGFLTASLASYLAIKPAILAPSVGEESEYCVVMGDDGSGILIEVDWYSGSGPTAGNIQWLDENGQIQTFSDNGMPAGVQSLNCSANVNRQNVLDIRSVQPVQFVTTYPIQISVDMEIYDPPVADGVAKPGDASYNPEAYVTLLKDLKNVRVMSRAYANKHVSGGATHSSSTGDCYVEARGLTKVEENQSVSVGRFLTQTFNFQAADLIIPVQAPS